MPAAGKEPVSRKFHSLTAIGSQLVLFGGQSLEDNADLNDLFFLSKVHLCSFKYEIQFCELAALSEQHSV